MKIRVILMVFFCILGGSCPLFAQASERIPEFDATIEVQKDASLLITERITVEAAGKAIRHGIVRTIPTSWKNENNQWIRGAFSMKSSIRDGKAENYRVEKSGDRVKIYFGSKDVFITPGRHTYVFTYTITRQLGFFEEYDELYWNVTGHDWAFPIEKARCTVRLPENAHVLESMAYEGRKGSTVKSAPVSQTSDFVTFSSQQSYLPGNGMTVAVSWPKGFVEMDQASFWERLRENSLIMACICLGLLLVYYIFAWIRVGRDPEKSVVIPRYEPPDGFSPAMCRVFREKNFDAKGFGASLVNMAVHGGLTIEENDRKPSLVFSETVPEKLGEEEKNAWKILADGPSPLELAMGNNTLLRKAMGRLGDPLTQRLDSYFKTNLKWFVPGFLFTFPIGFFLCGMDTEAAPFFLFMLVWLSGWSIGCFTLLKRVMQHFLRKEAVRGIAVTLFAIPFWGALVAGFFLLYRFSSPAVLGILAITLGLHGLFLFLLRAPTPLGQTVAAQLEGFELYLSVAEKDRLRILYDEEKTPELFEKFFPYAIALDLENAWGDRFSEVLQQASYSPDWYRGTNFSARSPVRFASSLGKAVASSTHMPSSGGFSSSSGFSGTRGGSSGGGRGGGGGGGW